MNEEGKSLKEKKGVSRREIRDYGEERSKSE